MAEDNSRETVVVERDSDSHSSASTIVVVLVLIALFIFGAVFLFDGSDTNDSTDIKVDVPSGTEQGGGQQ